MQFRIHNSVRAVLVALAEFAVFITVLTAPVLLLHIEQCIYAGRCLP